MSVVGELVPAENLSGGLFIASLLVFVAFLLGTRVVRHGVLRFRPRRERVLILGTSVLSRKVLEEIQARPDLRYSIVGVVDDAAAAGEVPPRYPVLGPFEHLGQVVDAMRPDRIIVALAERRGRLPVRRLLESRARGVVVEDGAAAYERLTKKLALEALAPSSVIFSGDFRPSRLQRAVARGLGLVASVVGLVVLAPVLGLIALAIKLDSRGPVLFVQQRVGLFGRPFALIKFRTMHPARERASEWERDNNDRITRVGRCLRRVRLDELPQLLNVLRGEMNLVGPRPHPVTNFELLALTLRNLNELTGDAIPYYSLRCAIRPGITGWAQVRYGYANTLAEETEKIRYDLYYVKHMSLWFDLRILFGTVWIVLSGRRAARADAGRSGGLGEQLPARLGRAA